MQLNMTGNSKFACAVVLLWSSHGFAIAVCHAEILGQCVGCHKRANAYSEAGTLSAVLNRVFDNLVTPACCCRCWQSGGRATAEAGVQLHRPADQPLGSWD